MVGGMLSRDDLRVAVTRNNHKQKVASGELVFHRCPPDPDCPHCSPATSRATPQVFDWSFLDAAYCISLQTREDRAAQAAAEFHRVGLCRHIVFCRPVKEDRTAKKNIWRSHRFVAQHARCLGAERTLILEDDVLFTHRLTPGTVREVGAAISRLPEDWMGFYLGHWPIWAHFVGKHVLATSSLSTHAYIANGRLLRWLCKRLCRMEIVDPVPLRRRLTGSGIDAAYSSLPGMYAYHPMIALQRVSTTDHARKSYQPGEFSRYAVLKRIREYVGIHHMRTAEVIAVMLSPLAWLIAKLKA